MRALFGALLFATACSSSQVASPRPLRVVPSSGATTQPLVVRIEGEGFLPSVRTDFGRESRSDVNAAFRAFVGDTELQDVRRNDDGSLSATIPPGIPPGSYPLRIQNPSGAEGALPNAFRVVTSAQSAAAFVIEPIGTQRAAIPFAVGIAAVDEQGRVVSAFTGQVRLSASTDVVAPAQAGPFVLGRLRGVQVTLNRVASGQTLIVEDDQGHRAQSAAFDVVAGPPQQVSLSGPANAVAGSCAGPFAVALTDVIGNPAAVSEATAVAIDVGPASGAATFADAACAQAVAGLSLSAGQSTAQFHGRFIHANRVTVRVAPASLPSASVGLNVDAGVATQLGFLTPSRELRVGDCSGVIAIGPLDAFGNQTTVTDEVPLALIAAPDGGVVLYEDACLTPLSSPLKLTADGQPAALHLSAQGEGRVQLSVTGGALGSASQTQNVLP